MATPQETTSLDKATINRWRFNDTNGFVVKDYTGIEPGSTQEPAVVVLKCSDFCAYIVEASEQKRRIAVYSIGACVLDWS